MTANRIPETVDHSWIQQALWRELPAHAQGALYGFAGSVLHGLYDTALFLGRSVVQIGDMLTGLANHDHPYMQELWGTQKAISDGLIYSISHPIQTARSLIQVGKEKYHAALAEEDPFEQSRGLGNIAGAVWQAVLSGATAAPAVAKAGAVTARVVGESALATKDIAGKIANQIRAISKSKADAVEYVDVLSERARQHILYGDRPGNGGHLWPGQHGKTPFPESWPADKIIHEISDIITSPDTTWYAQTGNGGKFANNGRPAHWVSYEFRDDVRIRVVYQPATGEVVTAFPDKNPVPKYKEIE